MLYANPSGAVHYDCIKIVPLVPMTFGESENRGKERERERESRERERERRKEKIPRVNESNQYLIGSRIGSKKYVIGFQKKSERKKRG